MLYKLLGAQIFYNIKVTSKNYLMDFAYRNICFLKFLNLSLEVWNNIQIGQNPNTSINKKDQFLQANKDNLAIYENEKKISQKKTVEAFLDKEKKINEWIKENKIIMKQNRDIDELNFISDKYVFPQFKEKLISLIKAKNLVLQFIFPQLIQNLFDCFDLFHEIKITIYEELNLESKKYTNAISDYFKATKAYEETIKKDEDLIHKMKNDANNEKLNYENKISILENLIKKLNDELLSQNDILKQNEDLTKDKNQLKKFNDAPYFSNGFYEQFYNNLKSELEFLDSRKEKLEKELNFEKEKNSELEKELKKYKIELNEEKNRRKIIENNFKQFLEKIEKNTKTISEQINEEKEKLDQL